MPSPWRSARLRSRSDSIKKDAKVAGLRLAVRMMDLTTLEGKDTPGKVHAAVPEGTRPERGGPDDWSVCGHLRLSEPRHDREGRSSRERGQGRQRRHRIPQRPIAPLGEARRPSAAPWRWGQTRSDMVIDRGAMLSGNYAKVFDEIAATKEACGAAHLKVILETGELGAYDTVRKASEIGISPPVETSSRRRRARSRPRDPRR